MGAVNEDKQELKELVYEEREPTSMASLDSGRATEETPGKPTVSSSARAAVEDRQEVVARECVESDGGGGSKGSTESQHLAGSTESQHLAKASRAKTKVASSPLFELVSQRYISIEALKEFNDSKMYWRYKDSGGGTPLHRLCANTACTARHIQICSGVLAELRVAEMPDDSGRLALHRAATNPAATPELVTAVAELWPPAANALAVRSDCPRDTPLHAACRYANVPPAVLSALAQLDPRVCLWADHIGQVPFAVLCSQESNTPEDDTTYYSSRGDGKATQLLEQLVALGDVAPTAARASDAQGRMALHLLCQTTTSVETIEYVGRLFPDAAKTPDDERALGLFGDSSSQHGWTKSKVVNTSRSSATSNAQDSLDASSRPTRSSSTRRRRASLSAAKKRMTKMFGNMSDFMGGSPTARENTGDGSATPLHILCRRSAKVTPELIEAVAELFPKAADIKTTGKGYTPLHYLCLNEHNCTFQNIKTLVQVAPEAVDVHDKKNRTPLDCLPNWLVDQMAPQLMDLLPRLALTQFKRCNWCLLHYACTKEHDVVEAVVESMYAQLQVQPPLAVYLQLPEASRERLATTRVIVNQVDRIFTAPSIVAYLVVEFLTAILLVFMFFDVCIQLRQRRQRPSPERRFLGGAMMGAVHILMIMFMKAFQARALYAHSHIREFVTIWNCADFATVVCFIATLATGLYDRNRSFRIVASISQLIVPFRILRIIKGLNKRIGAFVLCLTNIISAVLPFLFVFAIVIVSFSQSLHFLLLDNESRQSTQLNIDGSISSFNPFQETFFSIYEVILIALVGDFQRDLFQTDMAIILICLMLIVVVVILLNVLISVVSDSYERTLTNAESIYLRSRLETAAEMQQVFPASFFNRKESRVFALIGIIFLPFTLFWLAIMYLARVIRGPRVAEEFMPRRIFAYAKPPGHEEENERNGTSTQTDVLQRNLLNFLKKFQGELNSRINHLEAEVKLTVESELQAALDRIDREFKTLKADQDYKDALKKQNVTLDKLMNNLSAPVAHLPADLRSRLDRERGVVQEEDDDEDAFFPTCSEDLERTRLRITC